MPLLNFEREGVFYLLVPDGEGCAFYGLGGLFVLRGLCPFLRALCEFLRA